MPTELCVHAAYPVFYLIGRQEVQGLWAKEGIS